MNENLKVPPGGWARILLHFPEGSRWCKGKAKVMGAFAVHRGDGMGKPWCVSHLQTGYLIRVFGDGFTAAVACAKALTEEAEARGMDLFTADSVALYKRMSGWAEKLLKAHGGRRAGTPAPEIERLKMEGKL